MSQQQNDSMSSNDSTVIVENQSSKQEEEQQPKESPTLITNISLHAVRLSESVAKSALAGLATTGFLASSLAPSSLVMATSLVAEAQTQSLLNVASNLIVHIPSDSVSMDLMKRLVASYAVANPQCFAALAGMSSTQVAATTAIGGALPLLVAAALQESIEVSKLVSGRSNQRQFFVRSTKVVAQVGGGLGGLAFGAMAGSFILPGLGTGIGSVFGSYAGATLIPWVVDKALGGEEQNNNDSKPKTHQPQHVFDEISASDFAQDDDDDKQEKSTTNFNRQRSNNQRQRNSVSSSLISDSHTFHFYWTEEVTEEGFVLINYDNNKSSGLIDEKENQPESKEAAQKSFLEAAKALLSRATVIPMADLATVTGVIEKKEDLEKVSSQAVFDQIVKNSSRVFRNDGEGCEPNDDDNDVGTLLMIRSESNSNASLASTSTSQQRLQKSESRLYIAEMEQQQQVSAQIAGQNWNVRVQK